MKKCAGKPIWLQPLFPRAVKQGFGERKRSQGQVRRRPSLNLTDMPMHPGDTSDGFVVPVCHHDACSERCRALAADMDFCVAGRG